MFLLDGLVGRTDEELPGRSVPALASAFTPSRPLSDPGNERTTRPKHARKGETRGTVPKVGDRYRLDGTGQNDRVQTRGRDIVLWSPRPPPRPNPPAPPPRPRPVGAGPVARRAGPWSAATPSRHGGRAVTRPSMRPTATLADSGAIHPWQGGRAWCRAAGLALSIGPTRGGPWTTFACVLCLTSAQ